MNLIHQIKEAKGLEKIKLLAEFKKLSGLEKISVLQEFKEMDSSTSESSSKNTVTYVITPAQYPNNESILLEILKKNGFLGGMISPNKKGWSGDVITVTTKDEEELLGFLEKRYDPMQEAYDLEGKVSGYYKEDITPKIRGNDIVDNNSELHSSLERIKDTLDIQSDDYSSISDDIDLIEANEDKLKENDLYQEVIAMFNDLLNETTQDSIDGGDLFKEGGDA